MPDIGPLAIGLGRRLVPGCAWSGDGSRPEVALTFDDGPDPEHTPRLLDLLAELETVATFFWLGDRLAGAEAVARRVGESGHAIALHGDRHSPFLARASHDLRSSLDALRAAIAAITRRDPDELRDVRPPYGLVTRGQVAALGKFGYRVVQCDVLPGDWAADPATVAQRVLRHARAGSIIALHDGGKAGRSVADTVATIVPALRTRGLRCVGLRELLASGP